MPVEFYPSVRDPLAAFPRIDRFDPGLFARPSAVFRGAPFWSWNGALQTDRLKRHLDIYHQMGIGGVHIHARTGLQTPYLGDEFMSQVRTSVEQAERLGMLVWLYDEDRWPSGFAGGLVTRNPKYRYRVLRLTRRRIEPGEIRKIGVHHGPAQPVSDRRFAAAWALRFDGDYLSGWRRTEEYEPIREGETGLYAYVEIPPSWSWFNHQQYANLMDPRAIAEFIRVTHERYREAVGDRFGKTIPAIFTDEPLLRGVVDPFLGSTDQKDRFIAWVDDFPQTYQAQWSEDVFDRLPAVLFEASDGSSAQARLRFRNHHNDRFVQAFAAQLGRWCEENGIALTGHMMAEPRLDSQSFWGGEVMRSLQHFHLPGIDMLCDLVEYTTAKQAQSVARQKGRPGVMSELYGVTNWDFPFAGHLRQGNWQAALGVTVRVHHLSWYSMAGEAKRDYPASIGWHVPWYEEYRTIESHFARVSVAMQTGKPICRVAMLHPIESFWAIHGPQRMFAQAQQRLERGFSDTLTWLINQQIDTDLISEALLPELSCPKQGKSLTVGQMSYDAVVLPPLVTIRSTTLDRLESFVSAGGTVISLAEPPALVDGLSSDRAKRASADWQRIEFDQTALLRAVEPFREIEVRTGSHRADAVVYQLRQTSDERILFICSNHRTQHYTNAVLRIRGHWHLQQLDTLTGETSEPGETWTDDGWTELTVDLPVASHLLLRLTAQNRLAPVSTSRPTYSEVARTEDPVPVTLTEPNVLVLDRPEWKLDQGPWRPAEDVLRVDNEVRKLLDLPLRDGALAQPWCEPVRPPRNQVTLRYQIVCDVPVALPRLALERASQTRVVLDQHPVEVRIEGYYVDEDIPTFALPPLSSGTHVLEITLPLGVIEGLEACYLLGDFGVRVVGKHARIIAPVRELAFGDYVHQGLPFYGGNVIYHCRLPGQARVDAVRIPRFGAPLLAVEADGRRIGQVIRAPYRLELPPGIQKLDLICFGDRGNTFGPIHNCNEHEKWWGPEAWRSSGEHWNDAYQLRPKGILISPILESRS